MMPIIALGTLQLPGSSAVRRGMLTMEMSFDSLDLLSGSAQYMRAPATMYCCLHCQTHGFWMIKALVTAGLLVPALLIGGAIEARAGINNLQTIGLWDFPPCAVLKGAPCASSVQASKF